MLWGVALGDALGAPYEFSPASSRGAVDMNLHAWTRYSRMKHAYAHVPPGATDDDLEMTLATMYGIIDATSNPQDTAGEYIANAYMEWGQTSCPYAGRNTRDFLFGIKTMNGLLARVARKCAEPTGSVARESNGFIMRASPLALINDEALWYESARLTGNVSNECRRGLREYVVSLRELIEWDEQREMTHPLSVVTSRATHVDIERSAGWFECALLICRNWQTHATTYGTSFREAIRDCIAFKGDADTNAAILGSMIGAKYGYNALYAEMGREIDIMRACDCVRIWSMSASTNVETSTGNTRIVRPRKYLPCAIDDSVEMARSVGLVVN